MNVFKILLYPKKIEAY